MFRNLNDDSIGEEIANALESFLVEELNSIDNINSNSPDHITIDISPMIPAIDVMDLYLGIEYGGADNTDNTDNITDNDNYNTFNFSEYINTSQRNSNNIYNNHRSNNFNFSDYVDRHHIISNIYTEFLNSVFYEGGRQNIWMNNSLDISNLKSQRYDSLGKNLVKDCSICITDFAEDDEINKLNCEHIFHTKCLNGWVEHLNGGNKVPTCPNCREKI